MLLSAAVRADRLLSANEQKINFFILHSADGSGRQVVEFPTCAKPWTLAPIKISCSVTFRTDLERKNDLGWFDSICELLKKDRHPTTRQLTQLIGSEEPNPNNEIRGSKFLVPFDKRFVFACINPIISENDPDKPIEYFAVGGKHFSLKMSDLVLRFPQFRTQRNIYDGGTQIFFYPLLEEYEFSALSFDVDKVPEEIESIASLVFHGVTFQFGDNLLLGRDGYHMRR